MTNKLDKKRDPETIARFTDDLDFRLVPLEELLKDTGPYSDGLRAGWNDHPFEENKELLWQIGWQDGTKHRIEKL